ALVLSILALAGTALTGTASAYVGGHDALKDKPFVAGIRLAGSTNFFCTATLIDKNWVLTAAHCLKGKTASGVVIVIGDTNLKDSTDATEVRTPDSITLNSKWHGTADRNDVALMHLAVPSTIAPVRLGITPALTAGMKRCVQLVNSTPPNLQFLMEQTCISGVGKALGWGRRTMSGSGSTTLREVTPKIFGSPRKTYWRVKSGACPGDSGGPLLALAADGSPRQIGIASYNEHGGGLFDWLKGDQCSTKGFDYYSDVSGGDLRTWVESITRIRDHRS
ncbi:MAG: serine protease 27, partial [Solirubrobacteraceae bacterium]|nr:serine protease 27 [Solirubrobacteraceae bacterium]